MRFSTQKRAFIELAILKMNDNEQNDIASFKSRLESLEQTIQMMSENGLSLRNNPKENRYSNIQKIPSKEELMSYKNSTVETPQNVVNTTNLDGAIPVTVKEVENIINNASKEKREALLKVWPLISTRYDIVGIQILVNGKLMAASEDSFIVELKDTSFCNRAMQHENFVKIIEILNQYGLNIKDYICLPQQAWRRIIQDYKSKYSKDNPKPVLEEFNLGVVRRNTPKTKAVAPEANLVNQVLEYFNDNELKIVEE